MYKATKTIIILKDDNKEKEEEKEENDEEGAFLGQLQFLRNDYDTDYKLP